MGRPRLRLRDLLDYPCIYGSFLILAVLTLTTLLAVRVGAQEVPAWVLRGIAKVESNSDWRDIGAITYRDQRIGAAGEVGPWQLSPDALSDLGMSRHASRIHRDVVLAESLTRAWLLRCHRQAMGNWYVAVGYFHTGPAGSRRIANDYAQRVRAAGTTTN